MNTLFLKIIRLLFRFLHIDHDQETSMHCHPNKTTGLILLDGVAEISFLTNKISVESLQKVMIRKGLFHSTKAISKDGADIFEIETPVNKHDLVRLEDKYGRKAKPYEGKKAESKKGKNDLIISLDDEDKTYRFSNCIIEVKHLNDTKIFNQMNDPQNIIFLDGGILTEDNVLVAQAGDVVTIYTLKKLIELFPILDKNTKIMIINSDGKL